MPLQSQTAVSAAPKRRTVDGAAAAVVAMPVAEFVAVVGGALQASQSEWLSMWRLRCWTRLSYAAVRSPLSPPTCRAYAGCYAGC